MASVRVKHFKESVAVKAIDQQQQQPNTNSCRPLVRLDGNFTSSGCRQSLPLLTASRLPTPLSIYCLPLSPFACWLLCVNSISLQFGSLYWPTAVSVALSQLQLGASLSLSPSIFFSSFRLTSNRMFWPIFSVCTILPGGLLYLHICVINV